MFRGKIIRAPQFFKSMGKMYEKDDIPWKPWGGERPDWQYCTSKTYAGTMGGWLLNKTGTDKWFYLSESPNPEAFEVMENYKTRPRGATASRGGASIHTTCTKCKKSFRANSRYSFDPHLSLVYGLHNDEAIYYALRNIEVPRYLSFSGIAIVETGEDISKWQTVYQRQFL